jgi:hypothetical protein
VAFPTLILYIFQLSVDSTDTIFILGDGLIRLLLRWKSPVSALGKVCTVALGYFKG